MRGHIRLKPSPERETTIPLDKFEALVSELPDWMKLPARLQHFTGCRPSEIRELLWRNVFIDENCLKFEPWQVKEGKPRTVYLSEYFTAALAANFSKAPKNQYNQPISEYVFHGPKSKRIREDTYHAAWQRACERLGFIDPAKRKKSGRPVALFKKHDLRRTRISALMANGTNIKLIQNQVGHSGAAMTLKYTQPEKEAQLEMAQQIEDIDRSQFEKSKKRIEEIEAKKKRLLDVLQGKDVWTTEDVVKLVEEI
jgi:integrase